MASKKKKALNSVLKQANRVRTLAVQNLRRSNAAGKHRDKRFKRNRTRQSQITRAITDSRDS